MALREPCSEEGRKEGKRANGDGEKWEERLERTW